ncbi:MAG: protein BatD [Flavobacteriaceae bacterium]|nr:BatD family protein [Bacteroidia bacterium]NNL61056.1 protein BatD [Flavobacteriaceae bacterium]
MRFLTQISFLFLFLSVVSLQAQIKFEAKVSKKSLGVNERLRVDFEMNKDGDNFVPPSFSDFTVVGGPSQSISNSWVNGKRSYSKSYTYYLAPKKKGTFTIKQASVEIDGEIYKTLPVTIKVKTAVDKPKDGNNASYEASENIHLVAEVSKNSPYLNEPITVVYKLYVGPNTGVDNWRETDTPRYNDFWSQNIDIKGIKVTPGKYKGEDYRYVILRKAVLYPQKTGKLEIEPLVLDVTVKVPTNRRDIFGGRLMKQIHLPVSAGRRSINVKPLPEGKPSDFTGAVGDFDFKVTTSKTQLDASESLQARVEVSGKGNLKLFELPKLNLPSSLEVYEPEHSENVRTNLGGMRGKTADSYTVVPQFQGKYPIPSISFSYFDLETESYKRISSEEIVIDVLNGPVNNATSDNNLITGNVKQRVVLSNEQFAFVKSNPNLTAIKSPVFFKTTVFWASLLSPLLLIPLTIVFMKKRDERLSDVKGNRIRKADRLARKYLSEAKRSIGNKDDFYEALERSLHNYLKAKLNIETSDLSKERIQSLLSEKQAVPDTITEFIGLLKSAELARYTPFSKVEMQLDYEKAAKTISAIDKQIR